MRRMAFILARFFFVETAFFVAGSADDNAYNTCTMVISDKARAVQKAVGLVSDYTGASKTITLASDPGIFTMAVGDNVSIIATSALANIASENNIDFGATKKASINAEVLDVLNTDTFAEPGQEAPGATVTLVKKIGYLYKAFRNKIEQTSTETKLYNDDGHQRSVRSPPCPTTDRRTPVASSGRGRSRWRHSTKTISTPLLRCYCPVG